MIKNNEIVILVLAAILAASLLVLGTSQDSFAHQSGCHRWHSCPSDHGTYECGDTGHCSQCPDNNYCKDGQARSSGSSSSGSSSSGSSSSGSSSSGSSSSGLSVSKPATKSAECKGTKLCINGMIRKIIDGDTLVIDKYTVRLSLTNTPERNEKNFKEATTFTRNLCHLASNALVDQDDGQPFDKYGRMIGKVTCADKILNSELLDNGHANILTQYCKKSEFSSESWAKKYGCAQTVQKMENKQTSSQSPASAPSKTKENNCDPSYPNVCIPPWPPDLDCGDIQYRNFKVLPPDPHKFDGDKDGIGCEE